ncbi:MAG: biopolymer transporter ExbD [Planctomycetota bacterium]
MAKKMGSSAHHEEGSGTSTDDRPWVFFMVDCFFLITEFFILTFKFKIEESVLPQKLPPGGTVKPQVTQEAKESLRVHVTIGAGGSAATYDIMNNKVSLQELSNRLATLASSGPNRYIVRVSYDQDVHWESVLAVFNACNRVKIQECGLVPLRGLDVRGGPERV